MRAGKFTEISEESKRNSQRAGVRLSDMVPSLDVAFHCGDFSSHETCLRALKAGGLRLDIVKFAESGFIQGLEALHKSCSEVLVVASKKKLWELVDQLNLLDSNLLDERKIPKCGFLCFEFIGEWNEVAQISLSLKSKVTPKDLSKFFPFKKGEEIELRERPAYYYNQSAVIPCKLSKGKLEILLIKSSSGKKWGVPKGVIEPDLTPWDSAAKEAFEEGGVRGKVSDVELGKYTISKWGHSFAVSLYLLEVKTELSKKHWLESERTRKWYGINKAVKKVSNPQLSELISNFAESIKAEV